MFQLLTTIGFIILAMFGRSMLGLPALADRKESMEAENLIKKKIAIHEEMSTIFDKVQVVDDFKEIGPRVQELITKLKDADARFLKMDEPVRMAALKSLGTDYENAKKKEITAKRNSAQRALKDKLKPKDK